MGFSLRPARRQRGGSAAPPRFIPKRLGGCGVTPIWRTLSGRPPCPQQITMQPTRNVFLRSQNRIREPRTWSAAREGHWLVERLRTTRPSGEEGARARLTELDARGLPRTVT